MFVLPAALTSAVASCAASCACCAAGAAGRALANRSARLAYCAFFSATLVLAWVLRLGAEPVVKHLPCECWEDRGRNVPRAPAWRLAHLPPGRRDPRCLLCLAAW